MEAPLEAPLGPNMGMGSSALPLPLPAALALALMPPLAPRPLAPLAPLDAFLPGLASVSLKSLLSAPTERLKGGQV